jgi:Protein-L-isoaspartate carboxylmethyltransferase
VRRLNGHVLAFEVDEGLASQAARRLASRPWIEVRNGDASAPLRETFDAILVNAGVTHPLDSWLDGLAPGGHMMLPVTASMPAMGATLGKGVVVLISRDESVPSARVSSRWWRCTPRSASAIRR